MGGHLEAGVQEKWYLYLKVDMIWRDRRQSPPGHSIIVQKPTVNIYSACWHSWEGRFLVRAMADSAAWSCGC